MKSILLLVLYITILITFVQSGIIYDDLAKFCSNNGLVYLSLTNTDEEPKLHSEAVKAFVTLEKHGLRVRTRSYAHLIPVLDFNIDTLVLLTAAKIISAPNDFQMYLKQIGKHRIRKAILVFSDALSASQEIELKNTLQDLVSYDAWFTILYQNSGNITVYKNILSLNKSKKLLYKISDSIKLTRS